MKKLKILVLCIALSLLMISPTLLSGCDFTINYKGTSDKLNEVIALLDNEEKYKEGSVKILGENITLTKVPQVSEMFTHNSAYDEVNKYYNTIFSYTIDYIKSNAKILATPPTVEALTERQEKLYQILEEEINEFKNECNDFNKDIERLSERFENLTAYGSSSSDVFVLDYKKAYRDFIYDCFDLANAVEDVMASVYSEIDYIENVDKKGAVFKSFEDGINIRIFEGYFSFIADTFDCSVPTENKDANGYMKKILTTYTVAKSNMLNFYKEISTIDTTTSMTMEEIEAVKNTIDTYFEETQMFQRAYEKINFSKFYFDDDCALDDYVKGNYANKHYYDKICEYINYTLPNLTNYISQTFSA